MQIHWSDMPSFFWKIWFVATLALWPVLVATTLALFLEVFLLPSSPLGALAAAGIVFLALQQILDIRYARKYLLRPAQHPAGN